DIGVTSIPVIQGSDLCSPLVPSCTSANIQGQFVNTTGNVVTGVGADGFTMQDPVGDGNRATSDGIFVYTLTSPLTDGGDPIVVGDVVTVRGRVDEYFLSTQLTVSSPRTTQFAIERTAQGAAMPAAVT